MSNYTLYHADCLEKMKEIPSHSIDLILCDLPYRNNKMLMGYSHPL